jgi:hypothetical protein
MNKEKVGLELKTLGLVSLLLSPLAAYSYFKQVEKKDLPPPGTDFAGVREGWDCASIPEGGSLTNELRERGTPGIDPGPYKLTRRDGTVEHYTEYNQLPNLVYPGEEFCIKVEPQSFNIDPQVKHGVVFENFNKQQNQKLAQNSINTQASIKARQGF